MENIVQEIKIALKAAILSMQKGNFCPIFDIPEIKIEYPANEKFGDYATNLPMILAKKCGKNPLEVAKDINKQLTACSLQQLEKIEISAPGYINFYLSKKHLQGMVAQIRKKQENFGSSAIGKGLKVNNEFISANPTGPLHLGNGRGGFYGDALSNVLRKAGMEVVSEYYVNDAGEQVAKLGHSVLKDDKAAYSGDYIDKLNQKFGKLADISEVGEKATEAILADIKKTISGKMKIDFDSWVSERNLHDSGKVKQAIEVLKKKDLIYEKDGALWLKTTGFGDDKDRVLIKSSGQKAYFASDCGYILDKKERGFDKIIEIWGADHHGYVSRFRAAAEALGFEKNNVKFVIVQLVRLVKDGKEARMSKRAGNVIYIDELIDKVGHDVARFFFLMYSPNAHMNFDLGLAEERSEKNPVYYVQYAHARIASILIKVQDAASGTRDAGNADLSLLAHEKELSLMKELNKFPEIIEEIAESYAVHKLPQYAIKLADKFHSFYNDCRVIDRENQELSRARQELVNAVKIVLAETLRLIGVSAPNKM